MRWLAGTLSSATRAIDRFHTYISTFCMYVGVFFLGTMTCAILVQVVMRYVIGNPISWIEEYCVSSMFIISFLLGPYLILRGMNISMTLFYDRVTNKTAKFLLDLMLNAVTAAVILFIFPSLINIVSSNMDVANTQLPITKGSLYLVAPFSFFLMFTIILQTIVRDIALYFRAGEGLQD